jgi:hypothetical protein
MIYSETKCSDQQKLNIAVDNPDFANKFQDVVTKIQIQSDLTIAHPDYDPLIVSAHYGNYLAQMSNISRDRYLTSKLQQYLYEIFIGDRMIVKSLSNDTNKPEKVINYQDKYYKTEFYDQLLQCNHGKGYSDSGWLIVAKSAGSWRVSKNGLTLNIEAQRDLVDFNPSQQVSDTVSVKMPSNLVDRGLYIAVGDAGSPDNSNFSKSTIIQLYFNVDSKTALLLLDTFTQQLNQSNIPFKLEIPYCDRDFQRLDAVVLEFRDKDWQCLQTIIKNIYLANQNYFNFETPFFCKKLGLGLGFAEKPNNNITSNYPQKNIGQFYCHIVAQAMIKIFQEDDQSNNKIEYIIKYLFRLQMNLKHFYLNPGSCNNYNDNF